MFLHYWDLKNHMRQSLEIAKTCFVYHFSQSSLSQNFFFQRKAKIRSKKTTFLCKFLTPWWTMLSIEKTIEVLWKRLHHAKIDKTNTRKQIYEGQSKISIPHELKILKVVSKTQFLKNIKLTILVMKVFVC